MCIVVLFCVIVGLLWRWRSRRCPPQRQRTWMTWSRQLFQFVLCGHLTPRCWTSQKRELSSHVGLFRSRLRTLGTHYHPTLDPPVPWTPSNVTLRPICSDSLNLMPPAYVSSDFMALYKSSYYYYYSSSSSTNFFATQVLNKSSGPLCVTYYTTAVLLLLLL